MSVTKALLLLYIITYSISLVTCIKCYGCNSWDEPECEKNPKKHKKFELDCSAVHLGLPSDQCLIITGKKNGKNGIVRFCSVKKYKDNELELIAKELLSWMSLEKISARCNTDLCNGSRSSISFSIGFLSLIGVFLSLVLGRP